MPGGTINADTIRQDADAVSLVKAFAAAGSPVAAICHGPWLLVEAGLLKGKELTSFASLQTDLRNAGASWVDRSASPTSSSGFTLVTSRDPDDLDDFVDAVSTALASARGLTRRRGASSRRTGSGRVLAPPGPGPRA